MRNSTNLQAWFDLITFQRNIAERWLEKGDKTRDVFAKFFFYFAGFNAIYFLWAEIDKLDANEGKLIDNLLEKLGESKAEEILNKASVSVKYFCERPPIQRMDKRDSDTPSTGEKDEGRKWKKRLQSDNLSASQRICAMGQVLYLVRSNLVHGSKAESGDDREVIEASIEPLRIFLVETIHWTKQCVGTGG